jgi:hypothetical protein
MSELNFIVGMLGVAAWLGYRAWRTKRVIPEGSQNRAWLIPFSAFVLPLLLLLYDGIAVIGLNGVYNYVVAWSFLIASFIGIVTMMILHVQGNLNFTSLKQHPFQTAFIFSCFTIPMLPIGLMMFVLLFK